MNKQDNKIKEVVKEILGSSDLSCSKSKPDKYDGWRCIDIPEKDWPIKTYCLGCLLNTLATLMGVSKY